MKIIIQLMIILTFSSCNYVGNIYDNLFDDIFDFFIENNHPNKGDAIDCVILKKAEKIYSEKSNYSLLIIDSDIDKIESERYLYLYDSNNRFIDWVRIYGMVQDITDDYVVINKSASGRFGKRKIGGIKIKYKPIDNNRGGVSIKSYIIHDIEYNDDPDSLIIVLRESKNANIFNEGEIKDKSSFFNDTIIKHFKLSDFDLNPKDSRLFYFENEGEISHHVKLWIEDDDLLDKFFKDIEYYGL